MQDIKDGEVAVWKHGMTKAFELLRKANNCALCQQAIMVLSDGTTSSLSDLFKENNADKKVYVGYTANMEPGLNQCNWIIGKIEEQLPANLSADKLPTKKQSTERFAGELFLVFITFGL